MDQETAAMTVSSPKEVPATVHGEVEVTVVARPRQFSTSYKRRIVREAASCDAPGAVGALLRREGLYSSHLTIWRRELASAELAALAPKRLGPKVDVAKAETRRVEVLERNRNRDPRRDPINPKAHLGPLLGW